MNMIHYEQRAAKEMYASLFNHAKMVITSGVLTAQREIYLQQAQEWNWKSISEKEEEGWLAFCFEPMQH